MRASTGLLTSVRQFVLNCVAYDRPEPDNVDGVQYLWTLLDVEPSHIDLFVRVNPSWDGSLLHVSASLLNDADAVSAVSTLITYTLKWTDFSETRWTKVGEAGRLYLRSLLTGIDGLVRLTEQSDAICKWHLAGYNKRSSASVRLYLAVAAAAARPTENMLLDILTDDRFLLRMDRCWDIVNDEHRYLLATPTSYFETVGDVLGMNPIDYRSHVVEASLTSISYLHMDIWAPLSEAPWTYFHGDARQKMTALMEEEGVTHPVAVKMQTLARLGYEEDVIAACVLARESSLSTTLVEQFHASGAQLMRRHPQMEHATLCIRMTVHHARTFFYPNIFDKQEARLTQLLKDLSREMQNTKHSGARQAYCKLLIAQVRSGRIVGDVGNGALRRLVFKHHNKGFQSLSGQQVEVLTRHASADNAKKLKTLSESRQHVYSQLEVLRLRRKEAEHGGMPNHMDSMRFVAADYTRFAELWAQYTTSCLRGEMQSAPDRMNSAHKKLISDEIDRQEIAQLARPDWLSQVVSCRDYYVGAGFFLGIPASSLGSCV